VDALELDEDEGEPVDEADEVSAAAVDLALDPELLGDEEVVAFGVVPVDDAEGDVTLLVVVAGRGDLELHALLEQAVDVAVGVREAHRGAVAGDLLDGLVNGVGGSRGVELGERCAEAADEDGLTAGLAAEGAVVAEGLVVDVGGLPAHRLEEVEGGLFDVGFVGGWAHG